jgi:hypothetical protein
MRATVTGRTSLFVRAVAICGTLAVGALVPGTAAADDLVPSLGLQTGFTLTRTPGNDSNDYFVAATPQLIWFIERDRALIAVTYSFTGSLNSVLPNGIANRLSVVTTYDIAPKTRLIFGADALQALIGNYLVVRRSAATQLGQLPPLNTSLLTVGVSQGISHEISPVVRLNQGVTGTYVTSLDPDVRLRNYLATATVGIDRSWEFDAVGGEFNLQYARAFIPPIPATQAFTLSLGPTWDHDVSPTLSTSASVSAQLAFSPDRNTKSRIGPAGRASVLYSKEGSGIGLEYAGGIEPNILLGTLLQSHQVTLRGFTPLSERHNVILGVSGGYLHGKNLDLSESGAFNNEFDAILHDVDVTWPATDFLSLFVRYQFIGQTAGNGAGATPALVRHGAILGAELFASRPPPRSRLPQGRFPQRVDRGDAPNQGRPGGSSGSSSSPGSSQRR